MKVAIPVDERGKKILKVFGTAPNFLIFNEKGEVEYLLENIYACGGCKDGCGEGKNAADLLAENDIDALLTGEIAETPFMKLLMRKIAVYQIPEDLEDIEEAIKGFVEKRFKIAYKSF